MRRKPCGHDQQGQRPRGSSLVIVLGVLALLLVIFLSFFATVSSQSSSSRYYSAGLSARQLANTAQAIVMSQIRLASSGAGTNVWTSQPGLLRTFDVDGNAGDVFKLYSAANMRENTTQYTETNDAPAADWRSSPGLFVDINQPARDSSNYLVYPIVDPRAAVDGSTDADNPGSTRQKVTGFTLKTAPGYDGNQASATNNPAAMPVRWLYMLKDGQLAVPNSVDANGNIVFAAPGPSTDNPVVGRLAFWTDDETCKLNVNTAGYGLNDYNYWTYWDTPYVYSSEEEKFLSLDQPWKGEYQRYPGHPATTGLRLVLPELAKTDLFKVTPRLRADATANGAGSDGGTVTPYAAAALASKHDRLYSSIDELFYNASRGSNVSPLSAHDLATKRFFLTTQSRAPELNLRGAPRVTIWPEPQDSNSRTALDKLIAFCGTVGQKRFYFTRSSPASTTVDFALNDAAGSNQQLYTYLQRMTGSKIPGFGGPAGGFADKYGADRNQILTGIFDTIRLCNLAEKSPAVPFTSNSNSSQILGQVLPTENPDGSRGAGRVYLIAEATVVFSSLGSTAAVGGLPASTDKSKIVMGVVFKFWQPAAGAVGGGADLNYKITGLQSFSITARTDPVSSGTTTLTPFSTDTFQRGLREYRFAAVYGGANPNVTVINDTQMGDSTTSSSSGTYALPTTSDVMELAGSNFHFNGGTITVEVRAPSSNLAGDYLQKYTFKFPPVTPAINLPYVYSSTDAPWNDLTKAQNQAAPAYPTGPAYQAAGRFSTGAAGVAIQLYEVARSLQPVNGDYRNIAFLKDVPASYFQAPPAYNTNAPQVEGLENQGLGIGRTNNAGATQCLSGNLIAGFSLVGTTGLRMAPDVPIGIDGVKNSLGLEGDWDNGYGFLADGCYLPKPDEGVLYSNSTTNSTERGYFNNTLIDKSMFEGNAATLFSANRQLPSAGIFGSLPTGSARNLPWQTLLFRPARSYHMGGTSHPGAVSPPDYLLLDLFTMPVVEPYAISEPLSTAGKVNMNYRMKPFDQYITRDTAVRSVLESTMITGIPEAAETSIKGYYGTAASPFPSYAGHTRWLIDSNETLKYFEQRFDSTKPVFLSESEICDIDLVPQGWQANASSLASFWADKRTTGDNSRERPYALLYPRLTTRSNSYTIYVTTQALSPSPKSAGGWNENTGHVVGEWRGSFGLERYADPSDPNMPDFLGGTGNQDLSSLYKFRTLAFRRFSP